MYKLLIIDDEPLVQAGIRSMLPWEELQISVCGIASNGQLGWEIMEREHPDIVITDVKMPVVRRSHCENAEGRSQMRQPGVRL